MPGKKHSPPEAGSRIIKDQDRFPVAYMTAVTATTGAVSQRRIRSPMEQRCSPASQAADPFKPPVWFNIYVQFTMTLA